MPEVVLEYPLFDGHLGGGVQVLHLAAAAGTRMQTEMRAAGLDALGGLAPDRSDGALLPVVLATIHIDLHLFERKCALDEYHHAIGLVRHALRLEIERLDLEPFVEGRGWRAFSASLGIRHDRCIS